jgi:hypothetical protein
VSFQELKSGESKALLSSSAEEVGIGGFTLFARVSDETQYSTASPTSVVEDGSYIGDHLINAPIKISITGDVADIFFNEPPKDRSQIRALTVGKMSSFLPKRTSSQIQRVGKIIDSAADQRRAINEKISLGAKSGDFIGNKSGGKLIREQFIDFIESIHYGKQLVTISMPYRTHESMSINDVTVTRDNQRNALTFTLTAQKFRTAKTIYSDVGSFYKKPAPSVKSQTGKTANKGVQSPASGSGSGAGTKREKSWLSAVLGR